MTDIYDLLNSHNLIKKEKDIKIKLQKNQVLYNLNKYNIAVKKLNDSDEEINNIIITTKQERKKNKLENKISNYSETQDDENDNIINEIFNMYSQYLQEYEFIDDINNLKLGGYIRYINSNKEFRFGGILLKIKNKEDILNTRLLLKNTTNNLWEINFINNFIFYKKHKTKNDKFRNLFLKVAKIE
tara:strand:- start:119 stop:676 length:558 start_codon:yes stop_codon:yes gene_type:complete